MDILLIQPSYSSVYGFKQDISSILPPLNLMYLSSYLKEKGYSTKIIDLEIENESELATILRNANCKIFGISGVTSLFPEIQRIAKRIKMYDKKKIVIVGGSHATAMKKEILQICPDIDTIVFGEGEETLKELLDYYLTGLPDISKIPGIVYRNKKELIFNRPREPIKNIDKIPFPDHKGIDYQKYRPSLHRSAGSPFAVMITSRGCPFTCKYCGTEITFGNVIRFRSVDNIMQEIDYLLKNYSVKNIIFWDDTMTLDNTRVLDLCMRLKKYNINWSCNTRPDTVNLHLLMNMKKAGCKIIFYGVESANEKILNKLGRKMKLKKIEDAIKLTKKIGIRCTTSMMIGTPFDNEDQINKNIEYMINLNPDLAFFSPFAPHPGTSIYEYCVKNKLIPKWQRWVEMDFQDLPLNHPTANFYLTRKEIQGYVQIAYERFYSRKDFFLKRERKFKEEWEIKILQSLKNKFRKSK